MVLRGFNNAEQTAAPAAVTAAGREVPELLDKARPLRELRPLELPGQTWPIVAAPG